MNHIIPAEFQGTELSVIDHAGRRWLTAEQVGDCLGYSKGHEKKAIFKLYERHGDEFTEQDTCIVKLGVSGQNRATRIFSDTGCLKLGFFAATPRARDFRTWASKILADSRRGASLVNLAREIGDLKDAVQAREEIIRAKDGAIIALQSQLIGSLYGQNRLLKRVDNLQKSREKREAKQLIIRLEAEGRPRAEIAELAGRTLNHVRQVIWQARQSGDLPNESAGEGS